MTRYLQLLVEGEFTLDKKLAKYIDHTLLKTDTTKEEINQLIEEAIKYDFASVCINPHWVAHCYERLKDTDVQVCTVIGFPLGATSAETKTAEARRAITEGATELDMVINVGELKSGNDAFVKQDISKVVESATEKALTKVIIETSLLTEDEKIRACKLAKEANADFVKTSTGFSGGGATAKDIRTMRQAVGAYMGIKASGGIRDLETAYAMIEAGATRVGASSGVALVNSSQENSD